MNNESSLLFVKKKVGCVLLAVLFHQCLIDSVSKSRPSCLPFSTDSKSRYPRFDSQVAPVESVHTLMSNSVHRPLSDRAFDTIPPTDPGTSHPPPQWAIRFARHVFLSRGSSEQFYAVT